MVFRGTGKLQTQNVRYRNKAGGSVELVDTGHDVVYDDPICVSNQATCMSMTTPRNMAGVQAIKTFIMHSIFWHLGRKR